MKLPKLLQFKTEWASWRRLLQNLLYDQSVGRATKAKARLGLAIVVFVGIYGVIALRLVTFATFGDGHGPRHSISQDAISTARPNIHDRNGEIIAIDVRTPSLFAEPQGLSETNRSTNSGWNAAPTARNVIARIAPILGIEPRLDLPPADQLILVKANR